MVEELNISTQPSYDVIFLTYASGPLEVDL
uniref:Uncharacterized protein n=1 Tax=Arundo donax TaxID=35708 RepID=A0A0A9GRR7_ARUDO